jgi:hypothetical protein
VRSFNRLYRPIPEELMVPIVRLTVAAAVALACISSAASAATAPRRTLAHFASEAELKEYLDKLRQRYEEALREQAKTNPDLPVGGAAKMAPAAPMASAAPAPQAMKAEPAAGESVTNVQTQGVDEGGIVKVHGDHLVVLRRGRLFTVSIANGALAPLSMANAYGPGIDPGGAWYDEMLIRGDTVVVIGYSYQRGGTEIGLFDIDASGKLAHRGTYHLRANDYYSSRNYASRLIGDKLIFYSPLRLQPWGDPYAAFPAMREWRGAATGDFKRIAPATRIYRTDEDLGYYGITLHTVAVCDIARRDMECQASAVLGPSGRSFYVSKDSVYVWTTGYMRGAVNSAVFRMPLDAGAPSALKTSGAPVDQLSFLESDDGYLNVLLRAQGKGEAMWAAEQSPAGSMALMRVRLDLFGDGRDSAPPSAYRRIPAAEGWNIQNRFVGPYLLYGGGNVSWGPPRPRARYALHALRWADKSTVQTISSPHGIDRIEAMGRHAIVIGTAGTDLQFSSVRLADDVSIPHRFTRPDAAQGETRTHGFFYKPDGDETGIVGLPVVGGGRPGYKQLREGSAAVAFLRNEALALKELGELEAKPVRNENDNCKASCVDWYGNARPLFLRSRVFALMGYELVEGRLDRDGIAEIRRIDFTPKPAR